MEIINFLHHKMSPSVNYTSVSEDDYPVTNLISDDSQKQSLGFMAFKVTKPPVEINFELISPVEIHTLKLWSSIGSLKSTGFEIYVKYKEEFIKVAQTTNLTCDTVTFVRAQNPSTSSSSSTVNCNELFFNSRLINAALNETKFLRIVIKSTRKCPPVLKKLELWGYPSKLLASDEQEKILNMWKKVDSCNFANNTNEPEENWDSADNSYVNYTDPNATTAAEDRKRKHDLLRKGEYSIYPEEYVDAITYELMVFPMTLPCGKVVDQSTIDKQNANEEKWGRPPSDPFTGQPFTSERKPIFDAALKARIDKFLVEHAHMEEIKITPRNLGPGSLITVQKCKFYSKKDSSDVQKRFKFTLTASMDEIFKTVPKVKFAVDAALKHITKYTIPPANDKNMEPNCVKCSTLENLYKIETCNHLACKDCVLLLAEDQKCLCSATFQGSDVVRYHHKAS